MSVIPLTIFFSLLLAGLFMVLFAYEQRHRRLASPERDSLLPLADETPRAVPPADGVERDLRARSAPERVPPVHPRPEPVERGDGERPPSSHDNASGCLLSATLAKDDEDHWHPPCAGPAPCRHATNECRCRAMQGKEGCLKRSPAPRMN